jgi:hypothetical protein
MGRKMQDFFTKTNFKSGIIIKREMKRKKLVIWAKS